MRGEIKVQRVCELCHRTFEAKTTVTRFCGDYCAKRAYKIRKRNERIEASDEETRRIIQKPLVEVQARQFLSAADFCQLFEVSRTTFWRLCKTRKIKSVKIGRKRFVKRSTIDKLFE